VLEGLVGRDFLPRGKDIVTRRPLILKLFNHQDACDYAVFGHQPEAKYTDFGLVKREIEAETERVAGRGKSISIQPIHLSIHSNKLLPLTLVDLPGITKIPVADQPANIELQIRDLILDYASRPNSLLLAITPANSDLANSDALKLTREVDPSGLRTVGVLTKLDLMDAGTNALDILQNRGSFRLKHGFVGLVCRSQQDINEGVVVEEARLKEQSFFKNHPHYKTLQGRCGVRFLGEQLNMVHVVLFIYI
jgi:dynamin 1-like protein